MHGRQCERLRVFCHCYDLSSSSLKRTSEKDCRGYIPGCYIPINETFDDGHLCLLELLLGVSSCSVRQVDRVTDLDIISERNVFHFNTVGIGVHSESFIMEGNEVCQLLSIPFAKKLNVLSELGDIFWKSRRCGHFLDVCARSRVGI